jgi:hypothetical protein
VLAPAIALAEGGFPVHKLTSQQVRKMMMTMVLLLSL